MCATLPGVSHFPGQPRPFEAGEWRLPRTHLLLYPDADRPFPPPRSRLELSGPRQAARRYGPLPRTPSPLLPLAHTQARHAHTRQTRRPALKRKEKMGRRRPAGETPRLCKPQRGAAIAEAVPKHNSKTRSGPGGLGGSLPDRRCTGLGTRR